MVKFTNGNVIIENDGTFSLEKTFDCGQCFRFEKNGDVFSGVAFGKKLQMTNDENGNVVLLGVSEKDYEDIWKIFFDTERDYNKVNEFLSKDETVKKAISVAEGIRILKQDKWETLVSFIISQNNNIPRIKKIITSLCENFGDKCDGYYSFPSAEKILSVGVDGLSVIRSGFRAKYIIDAAEKVVSGEIDLKKPENMSYNDAKEYLMKIKGVGNKVADCVLLFAYSAFDAFPKDVWIKRVIEKYYGENFDENIFYPYGGIAQQYLFYYEKYILSEK